MGTGGRKKVEKTLRHLEEGCPTGWEGEWTKGAVYIQSRGRVVLTLNLLLYLNQEKRLMCRKHKKGRPAGSRQGNSNGAAEHG